MKHPYGAAVVGEEEAERIRADKKSGRSIYGKRVVGEPSDSAKKEGGEKEAPPAPNLSKEETTAEDAALSLKELGELLEESPENLDRQIDAEFQRAEGPRKGAIRLFLQVETNRNGGPRGDVLALLENALTGG